MVLAFIVILFFMLFSLVWLYLDNNNVNASKIDIGVYFYSWYSVSEHRHWDDTVRDQPYIGFYDSYNRTVIRWQLKLIKEAGIDFIVFSWWGPYSFEDNTTKIIVKYLKDYNLKFAIMIEPYLGNNDPSIYNRSFWKNVLNYIESNYVKPYKDIYFYLNGKPLVLAFNPIGMKYNPPNDFINYTIRIIGNDIDNAKYQDWDLWPDYLAPWVTDKNIDLRVRKDGYVAMTPRFDDRIFCTLEMRINCSQRLIDPNYALNAYEKEWKWILTHKDLVKIIVIYSWNEYHERSMIEPHSDNTANVNPFYVYNLTKQYIKELRKSIPHSAICDLSGCLFITELTLLILVIVKIAMNDKKRLL